MRAQYRRILIVLVSIGLLATAAPSANAASRQKAASGEPIKIGMVANNSGAFGLPQTAAAVQAYIDAWNKRGGYKGRPIQLLVEDAGAGVSSTSAAARSLLDEGVVAFAANNGLLDCQVNGAVYAAEQIAVIADGSVSASCYQPGIQFVTGRLNGSLAVGVALQWASDEGSKKFAMVGPTYPGSETVENATRRYGKAQKLKTKIVSHTVPILPTGADFDLVVAQLKAEGVDTVMVQGPAATANLPIERANAANFGPKDGIRWILSPTTYTPSSAADPELDRAYTISGGPAWETGGPTLKKALKILRKAKVDPIDGLAQGGYVSAAVLEQFFDNIEGPVTKASLLAAARRSSDITLLGGTTVDITDPKNNPEQGQIIQFSAGAFKPASNVIILKYNKVS